MVNKSRTNMKALSDNWVTDENKVKKLVQDYFENFFKSDKANGAMTNTRENFPVLAQDKWNDFNKPFIDEEIKMALFEMKPFKAPGPNILPPGFFQHAWSMVGSNITSFAHNFFSSGYLLEGTNDTFLVLISKVLHPERVK